MKKNILTVLAVLFAVVITACQPTQQNQTDNVACTMDAKICPDGTAVGREGPNCEFAACPETDLPEGQFVLDRKVIGESADECSRIRFMCEPGYEMYTEENSCGCVQYGYDVEFKGTDIACTREYNPVCVWFNQSVQCIDYPCAVNAGNTCEAQTIENADYYTMGVCPDAGVAAGGTQETDYISNDPEACKTMLFMCEDGEEPFFNEYGCGCTPVGKKAAVDCTEPRPEVCTMQYDPVCGQKVDDSRSTYGNSCSACSDPAVISYVAGEC